MTVLRRLLIWEGSSKKDFKAFPIEARKDMGVALFIVQLGDTPPSAKQWKGLGSGVYEIVDDHRGDTYRAVYVVNVGDCIHVLHACRRSRSLGSARRRKTWSSSRSD